MLQAVIVFVIVAICVLYLIARVVFKSKSAGSCSHGSCGCEMAGDKDGQDEQNEWGV